MLLNLVFRILLKYTCNILGIFVFDPFQIIIGIIFSRSFGLSFGGAGVSFGGVCVSFGGALPKGCRTWPGGPTTQPSWPTVAQRPLLTHVGRALTGVNNHDIGLADSTMWPCGRLGCGAFWPFSWLGRDPGCA